MMVTAVDIILITTIGIPLTQVLTAVLCLLPCVKKVSFSNMYVQTSP